MIDPHDFSTWDPLPPDDPAIYANADARRKPDGLSLEDAYISIYNASRLTDRLLIFRWGAGIRWHRIRRTYRYSLEEWIELCQSEEDLATAEGKD